MKRLLRTIPLMLSMMAVGSCTPTSIGNLDGGHPATGGARIDAGVDGARANAGTGGAARAGMVAT